MFWFSLSERSDISKDLELLWTNSVPERVLWRVWLHSDLDALPMLEVCSCRRSKEKKENYRKSDNIYKYNLSNCRFLVNSVELITTWIFEWASFADFHIMFFFCSFFFSTTCTVYKTLKKFGHQLFFMLINRYKMMDSRNKILAEIQGSTV